MLDAVAGHASGRLSAERDFDERINGMEFDIQVSYEKLFHLIDASRVFNLGYFKKLRIDCQIH